MSRATPIRATLLTLAVAGLSSPARGGILYVDDGASPGGDGLSWATAYDSLSTALTAARSGDQIWVAAGRYVGNFTLALEVELYGGFAGTETELTQRNWTANPTILDGDYSGSVGTSPVGATAATRIDGFTITRGSGTWLDGEVCGGGLYLYSSSPTIANNTITKNSAIVCGGGLYLDSSSPTIVNNTIASNTAYEIGGGGLGLYRSSATIAKNTIVNNGTEEGSGGGLYASLSPSPPTITNNTITGNHAYYAGGGLYIGSGGSTIANNMIGDNGAEYGGGLYVGSSVRITNNTIRRNIAHAGGGICAGGYARITNNLITGNRASAVSPNAAP